MRFSIIIANYNSEKWIKKLLDSICEQTYTDYEVIIVDDMSTDKSPAIISNYIKKKYLQDKFYLDELTVKMWNGGARNFGVEEAEGDYLLFADCDDWFSDKYCLEEIARIIDRDKPDLVRLPYSFVIGKYQKAMMLKENTPQELIKSIFVAPWTKCVKRELFVPFPENTLIEDVVQHIAQIDNIETISVCDKPIIIWNRSNPEAISATGHKYGVEDKRYSSIYRQLADLLDLRCKHDYCEKERQKRIAFYFDIVHNAKEGTIVERG